MRCIPSVRWRLWLSTTSCVLYLLIRLAFSYSLTKLVLQNICTSLSGIHCFHLCFLLSIRPLSVKFSNNSLLILNPMKIQMSLILCTSESFDLIFLKASSLLTCLTHCFLRILLPTQISVDSSSFVFCENIVKHSLPYRMALKLFFKYFRVIL